MTDFGRLTPEELRERARAIAQPHETAHWSELAQILGRIRDEQLYLVYGHPTARAYAVNELDLPPATYVELVERLWPLMLTHQATVPLARWREVSRVRALVLLRVIGAGGDVERWIDAAIQVRRSTEFQEIVDRALGLESWTEFRVRIPRTLEPTVKAAMVATLPTVLDTTAPDPARAEDGDVAFRALEVLCVSFLTVARA